MRKPVIFDEIYVRNKLPEICSKFILTFLLLKLTTENTFMFTSDFYKQTNGCTMGRPICDIFSDLCIYCIYIYIYIYIYTLYF